MRLPTRDAIVATNARALGEHMPESLLIQTDTRAIERGASEEAGRIEGRQRRLLGAHDQRDLRAAQHDGIAPLGLHAFDDLPEDRQRFGSKNAVHQLVEDDLVDLAAIERRRDAVADPVALEHLGIDLTFHGVPGSGDRHSPEASAPRLGRDLLHDVQPRQGRTLRHQSERTVERVVGTDQEIGADFCKLVCRGEH